MAAFMVTPKPSPTHEWLGSLWVLGTREFHPITYLNLLSQDEGETLFGIIQYGESQPLQLRLVRKYSRVYIAESRRANRGENWRWEGDWLVSGPPNTYLQKITARKGTSSDLEGLVLFTNGQLVPYVAMTADAFPPDY